jgi:threonine dehydrogenase-like Zn-dependent dehydrogenase
MKALVFTGNEQAEVRELPDPSPGPDEVLLTMRASGLCGSDMHDYKAPPERLQARPGPVVPGHEPSGVVAEVGTGVSNVEVGDRVSVYHWQGCGMCERCRGGYAQWCPHATAYSIHHPGAHADLMVVKARDCLPLPDDLTYATGAYIACGVGTGWSALRKLDPGPEDTLAVFGLGPIGLAAIALARPMGCRIIGVGRRAPRVEAARKVGVDEIIDIDECDDVPAALADLTAGGPTLAYETSGAASAHQWLMASLARAGKAVFVAPNPEPTISIPPAIGKELVLMGSFVMPVQEFWPLTRFLIEHRVPIDELVSHRFPLDQGPEAYRVFDSSECAKVIIEWPDP